MVERRKFIAAIRMLDAANDAVGSIELEAVPQIGSVLTIGGVETPRSSLQVVSIALEGFSRASSVEGTRKITLGCVDVTSKRIV